jgi:DNA-binding transcriptional MocR family regulator
MAKTKLYQQLVDFLRDQINQGVFCPGDKLPSIRILSSQQGVSIATVQRALEELEDRQLIIAKPKSGFYVCLNNQTKTQLPTFPLLSMATLLPKPVKIHELASQIFFLCDKPNVINLGTSYPHVTYFPTKNLQVIASKVVKQQINEIVEVHFSAGYLPLRDILAKRLNQMGCYMSSEDLIVTNGCLEALSICLRAVAKPGDTIAIESPGFVGLFQLIESLGFEVLEIPCHPTEGMSLEALEMALEQWDIKAVAIVPTFSNPLGSNMPEANRKRLVELLSDKEIPLIEDDLLGDMAFDGFRTKPCKAFDSKGIVLYCSSASKTIASGLRVGWIAPGAFYKEVSYFKTFTNISAPNFAQIVLAEFFSSGRYDRHLRSLTQLLAKRVFLFKLLIERTFPQGTWVSNPKGGCILWVVLPNSINGLTFFEKALANGIAIIPGQLSSATKKFDQCIRINCACEPEINIDRVINKLADIAKNMLQNNSSISSN